MRIAALVALCTTSVLANPVIIPEGDVGLLRIWPTARSSALAGSMTGLADEADATHFNPAGLAFQAVAKANLSYGNWPPGLYPRMFYGSAIAGAPIRMSSLGGHSIYVSGSAVYLTTGETDIVNEHGDFLGRVRVWSGTAAAHAGWELTNALGAGLGLRLVRSSYCNYNAWLGGSIAEPRSSVWAPDMNTAVTAAADIGVLYHPLSHLSIGAAVDNLGPPLVYRPRGEPDDLPRTARLGLCWTAIDCRNVRLRVLPELDKSLVRIFWDSTGTVPLGRKLERELKDAWKVLGIEAVAFNRASLRLAYLEDLTNQRGGVVLEKEGQTYHYGLWDALSRKGLGRLKSIGLCWGFGVGNDVLRFDVSSDAAIYDFPTQNWKLQLTCNDIGRLLRRS
jgi:hypothetical protein